jgi:hypothetical protein
MLVTIWGTKFKSIEQDFLVKRMLDKKIVNSSTEEIADEDGINRQLKTATDWGYIKYFNKTVLKPGPRLKLELPYLRFVASQLK